jgi:hypothetical protein
LLSAGAGAGFEAAGALGLPKNARISIFEAVVGAGRDAMRAGEAAADATATLPALVPRSARNRLGVTDTDCKRKTRVHFGK